MVWFAQSHTHAMHFVYGHTKCIHEVHCMRMRVVLNQKIYCDFCDGLCQFFLLKCFLLKLHIKYHNIVTVHLGSGFCVRGIPSQHAVHFM